MGKLQELQNKYQNWKEENPKKDLAIKIGLGAAGVAGLGLIAYKALNGQPEMDDFIGDPSKWYFVKSGSAEASPSFIGWGGKMGLIEFPESIKTFVEERNHDGYHEIFMNGKESLVCLFTRITADDIQKIADGFFEAGADPSEISLMIEAAPKSVVEIGKEVIANA